ncbi:MAG: cobalamin-binding protein [Calditrichaeota bacterium]|nr:MAG: cobalamin-binding protein [Calditrichota bacterium]
MIDITDDLNNRITLDKPARRIVSLVPSLTELVCDLGLTRQLVGRTRYCIHPQKAVATVPVVGGTKKPRFSVIRQMQPDLILTAKEENTAESVARLRSLCPVYTCDVFHMDGAVRMIRDVGALCDAESAAIRMTDRIRNKIEMLKKNRPHRGSAVYLIWENPLMAAGQGTFIHEMMGYAGFINRINSPRYPSLTFDALKALQPDYLLLASEPYPFNATQQSFFQKKLPHTKVILVDGTLYSWYGSRIIQALDTFSIDDNG